MIEMQVMGVALDTRSGAPIVVLSDKENRKALPIWIGTAEASAIIRLMENMIPERPMTHDLLYNILETFGATIEKIEIHDVNASGTYFAAITLKTKDGKKLAIDSRPSDAIALSLKAKCSIFVTPNVVASGTISTDYERDEQEAEEFRQFVRDVKPSDFQNLRNKNEESNQ